MYALFDIGGTKTRIAVSKDLKSFSEPIVIQTPQSFEEGIEAISKITKELVGNETLKAAAGGIAASVNREKTELVGGGSNITDWLRKPLKRRLEEVLGCPVSIENDTAMGGLAQVAYGPAQGKEIAVYVTVSTGVGGCRFVNGKIDKSALGFEPGWQIIGNPEILVKDRPLQEEGWLEGYCSKGYLMSHIGGACTEKEEGKKPYEITDKDFWDNKAKLLAYGLHNIYTLWSPDIIVIGGSMTNEIGISIEATHHYLSKTLSAVFPGIEPKLVPAEFGDEMGLWGAMAYLKQKKEESVV